MKVAFGTRILLRCFEQAGQAEQRWGARVGRQYIARVQILQAVASIDELYRFHSLRCHTLKGKRRGQIAITLAGSWRMIIKPGETDDDVIIHEVVDYHGS